MDLKFKRNQLIGYLGLVLVSSSLFFTNMAMAQEDADAADGDDESVELDLVVVTGSRILRAGFDTMQATTVITSEFVEETGSTNIADVLNTLPSFGPPGNSTQGAQNVAGVGAEFVNFFGLGSQRTLTLVNGRRFIGGNSPTLFGTANPGLQVDYNMLPASMIDRVEVIAIGGAPIYGADAIAGTVNVIMKRDYEGLDFTASHGFADENGDMQENRFTAVIGGNFGGGRGNIIAGFEWTDREGLAESERDHLAVGWQFREPFEESIYTRVLVPNAHANIVSNNGVLTPIDVLIPSLDLGIWPSGEYLQFSPDGSIVPYDVGTNTGNTVWSLGGEGLFLPDVTALFTPIERFLFNTSARYEITDNIEFFGEFNYANSFATEVTTQPAYQSGLFGEESGAVYFSADHPLLTPAAKGQLADRGIDNFWLQRSSVDLRDNGRGGNEGSSEVNMFRVVGGLQGSFAAINRYFDWDVSYNVGESDSYGTSKDISSTRFFYALDVVLDDDGNPACRVTVDPSSRPTDPGESFGIALGAGDFDDCVPLDIFGDGRPSDEALAYIQRDMVSRTSLSQTVFSANITFGAFELPAGELGMAFGVEHREENAAFDSGGWAQSGYGRSVPINSVSGGYETDEIYGEFYAPLVDSAMGIPLVDSASIEGAYRYVDNSRSGAADIWTIGGRWAPIQDMEFRGNVTRSVRAPAVTELFLPKSGTFVFASDPCDQRFVDNGNNPATRRANCIADGITDPDNFMSAAVNASVQGTTGGNQNLENETADAWTVGVIIRPRFVEGLQIAIDYVDIDLQDAIESFTLTQVMESCYDQASFPNSFCGQFVREPITRQLPATGAFEVGYVNAGVRLLKAWTVEADYSFAVGPGNMNTSLYLYLPQEDIRIIQESEDDFLGEPGTPDVSGQFNVRYTQGNWSGFVQTRYISKSDISNDDVENARDVMTIPAAWFFNANLAWNITPTIRVQGNINNIFDSQPKPEAIASGWDSVYDNIGRYYRLGVQVTF